MNGRVAIVTGASRGIGHAIAVKLASQGASLVLCGRDEKLLAEASAKTNGGHVVAYDLRLPAAGQHVVKEALQAFGQIDIVVNNAGATKRGDFETLTEEDWMDGYALKMFGAVRLTRAAWPHPFRATYTVAARSAASEAPPPAPSPPRKAKKGALEGPAALSISSWIRATRKARVARRARVAASSPA